MLRSMIVAGGFVALALAAMPAEAGKKGPLPCGDYDGVPSHNDCAPVSEQKQEKCQVWIDAGNGTDDPGRKEKYKRKYFKCVGYDD
jgi:hypothetical protein